ncbi:FtsX-like permease family protein [Parafilimonas sp.]|uniref:ABC transporter permease n=1 Tax=Parafilimonas sp. TaxID=1969739 RepID=UPI0039E2EB3B
MLANYLKIALRVFLRDKAYSFINLSGIIIGLASVFMIMAYVVYEFSYDKYYSNHNRVYRLVSEDLVNGQYQKSIELPVQVAPMLKNELPDVESFTSMFVTGGDFIIGSKPVSLAGISVDSGFFHVFNIPFVRGNALSFQNTKDVVITEKIANAYFRNASPIGLLLQQKRFDGSTEYYTIMGVIKNIPGNTHFSADIIICSNKKTETLNWQKIYASAPQYVLLHRNVNVYAVQDKIAALYTKYNFPKTLRISLQPVTSIHLNSNMPDEQFAVGSIINVYIFIIVAILILITGCINFINLTTARSLKRTKEIGIRKVMGAEKKQLAFQFIAESTLLFLFATPVAIATSYMLWPYFTNVLNIELTQAYLLQPVYILFVLLLSIVTGIIAGAYPALLISKFQPAHILKDWEKGAGLNTRTRKILIISQFVISISLIITAVFVNDQLRFLNNINLGFNKTLLISLPFKRFVNNSEDVLRNELLKNKNIEGVTTASWNAGQRYGATSSMDSPADSLQQWNFAFVDADLDFIKTMQIKLVEGRNFSPAYAADIFNIDSALQKQHTGKTKADEWMDAVSLQSIILSQQAAQMIHLKQTGQVLKYGALQGTVIGVVNDFLGMSLLDENTPVVIRCALHQNVGYTYVRISPYNIDETIEYMHATWSNLFPGDSFNFSFVDEKLKKMYDEKFNMLAVFNAFSVIAIVIALLGLFSLVAITIQQKTKEIGIRKILGANVADILMLLSKDYMRLIIIAILIAVPLALLSVKKWLQNFYYRIEINWWVFAVTAIAILAIALITIVMQTVKAANANPVKSLRSE